VTRSLYKEISEAGRNETMRIGREVREELTFWDEQLQRHNGAPISHPLHELIMRVGASESGWEPTWGKTRGWFIADRRHRDVVNQKGNNQGTQVKFEMDSFTAVRNLWKGGGPKADLNAEVRRWWMWCQENMVQATFAWIRREENTLADQLSKSLDRRWAVRGEIKARLWNG